MQKKVTFIGNPSGDDGRPWVELGGKTLRVGRPEIVDLVPDLLRKIENNSHFRVEDVADLNAPVSVAAETSPGPLPVERAPSSESVEDRPSEADMVDQGSAPDDDAPISVKRSRPKNK